MKVQKALENYISKAIENAEEDRAQAQALLSALESEMKDTQSKDKEKHERAGNTATKYLKAIQNSNDQIIELVKTLRKMMDDEQNDSVSLDSDSIYDDIQDVKFNEDDLEVEEDGG